MGLRWLLPVVLTLVIHASPAPAFFLSFDDLPTGVDVLDSYQSQGVTVTPGLIATGGGVPLGNPPHQSALITVASVSLHSASPFSFLSFYLSMGATDSLEVSLYDGAGGLHQSVTFGGQGIPWPDEWNPVATPDLSGTIAQSAVLHVSSPGSVRIDSLTDEGHVIPEPATIFLVVVGWLLLVMGGRRCAKSTP